MERNFFRTGAAFVAGIFLGAHEGRAQERPPEMNEDVYSVTTETEVRHEKRAEEKLLLPAIKFNDVAGKGFGYQNTVDRSGNLKGTEPTFGTVTYERNSLEEKQSTLERKLAHELAHQQWDLLPLHEKRELAAVLVAAYGQKNILDFLTNQDPKYQFIFQLLLKEDGEAAANEFLINEFVGWSLSYVDVPLAEPASVKSLFRPKEWESLLADGQTESSIANFCAQNPDFLEEKKRHPQSPFYDISDQVFFELQDKGLVLSDAHKQMLAKYGLGNNHKRAAELLGKIRADQAIRMDKQDKKAP